MSGCALGYLHPKYSPSITLLHVYTEKNVFTEMLQATGYFQDAVCVC